MVGGEEVPPPPGGMAATRERDGWEESSCGDVTDGEPIRVDRVISQVRREPPGYDVWVRA